MSQPVDNSAFFDPEIETMPRDQLRRLQEGRLLELLSKVYERSGLIREKWDDAGVSLTDITSLDDFLAKAPFIDKDAIRAYRDHNHDPCGGLMIAEENELRAVGFTSGTTGDPTPVPSGAYTGNDTQLSRDIWQIGVRPGDYLSYMMFTFRGGQGRMLNMSAGGFTPIMMPHDPGALPLMVEAIKTYRPTGFFMVSTPMLIGLEKYFETTGDDPVDVFSSVKGAIFGGEPLSPRFAALTKGWGLELFEFTSLGDVIGAMECKAHNGFHMWEDLVLVEALDDDGKPVPDGELGELVVTSLADPIAPLIRYRTEDIIRMDRSPCGCGRTHARFWVLGRKGDQTIVQGKAILPRDIQRLVEGHNETKSCLFQIIRPQMVLDKLRLRVGYEPELLKDSPAALSERLKQTLVEFFDVPVEIDLVLAEELLKLGPPQKIPRVTKQ